MIRINLRDYYPFYKSDFFVEVTNEIFNYLNSLAERNMQTLSADVSTKHTIPLTLTTVLKRMSSCWFYRRKKSMSAK
jgi:hypothetical protein